MSHVQTRKPDAILFDFHTKTQLFGYLKSVIIGDKKRLKMHVVFLENIIVMNKTTQPT